MLNGLKELVKKDGIFLFTIPNGFGPLEIMNQIQLKASDIWLGRLVRAMKAKIKIKNGDIQSSNLETPHEQFYNLKKFIKMLHRENIDVVSVHNSNCYLGFGVLWYLLLQKIIKRGSKLFQFLDMLDCAIADRLPHMFAAGWYFSCKHAKKTGE